MDMLVRLLESLIPAATTGPASFFPCLYGGPLQECSQCWVRRRMPQGAHCSPSA